MSKDKLIPELRFPEFKNTGEWELTSIGKIGSFYYGKSAPKWSLSDDAPTLCVRYGELYTKFETIITEVKSRTNIEPSDLKFSKGGEILVPRVGERATEFAKNCCYLPYANIAIGEMISVFETKEFPLFYTHYFKTLWREFAEVVEGQNVKNLYYINLEPIKIGKPSYEEQQKIASCLSSLDEVISAHSQKLDLLKDHKKGLMQNLFPSAGEKVPKYRFKEFEKDGEWVEKRLGESATFINGRAYKQEELLESGKYRVLRVGNFFTNNNWYYSDLELEENKYCEDGDLLYAWSASFGPRVWRGEKVIYHYHIWKVLPSESISNDFLFVLLDNETERMKTQNANGFALLHITKGTIENWECKIPKSKKEQQKIASCLSSLDALITAQVEKIEQLKLHKKGLMQGLFPKIQD